MTIRDVAARAGVSAATVSRVFSRPESVTVETRRRVLTAAEHLRYTPHPVARSLARGDTGNLGLVVPDIAVAFCAVVTKAVSQRARRDGYALFVADSDEPSTRVTVDDLRSAHAMAKQVDGLLLLSPTAPDDDLRALAAAVPLVVINRELDEVPGRPHAQRGRRGLGRRAPARPRAPAARLPRRPRQLLQPRSDRGVHPGPAAGSASTASSWARSGRRSGAGVRAADLVLADGATGVLAYNDDVAAGVVGRLTDRGVPVPARLSIVGFDDTALASMITPRLTTVSLPMADAGEVAVGLLVDVLPGRRPGAGRSSSRRS